MKVRRIGFVLRFRAHVMTFPDIWCIPGHVGAFGFVLRIRERVGQNGAFWGIRGHLSSTSPHVRCTIRLSKNTSDARKRGRLLLHPNRARSGQQSRTTARDSPEKRAKKFRILITPFARLWARSRTVHAAGAASALRRRRAPTHPQTATSAVTSVHPIAKTSPNRVYTV